MSVACGPLPGEHRAAHDAAHRPDTHAARLDSTSITLRRHFGTKLRGHRGAVQQGCPNGYQCYAAGSPDTATCAAVCNATTPCAGGLECSSLGVCTAPPAGNAAGSDSSGGCTLGGERGPAKPVPWVFAMLGVWVGLARRRRARL